MVFIDFYSIGTYKTHKTRRAQRAPWRRGGIMGRFSDGSLAAFTAAAPASASAVVAAWHCRRVGDPAGVVAPGDAGFLEFFIKSA